MRIYENVSFRHGELDENPIEVLREYEDKCNYCGRVDPEFMYDDNYMICKDCLLDTVWDYFFEYLEEDDISNQLIFYHEYYLDIPVPAHLVLATQDDQKKILPLLEQEFKIWSKNHKDEAKKLMLEYVNNDLNHYADWYFENVEFDF